MKTLQTIIAGILIVSCFVLSYSTVNFELAERHFENVRNGLACNRPGSSCPGPDFDSPVFYGIIGLGLYFAGMIMSIFKERKNMTRIALGATALVAGMPSLVSGVLAYANDYTHLVLVMKNCPNTSCMY
ncbi:MAG: hypothetical protein ACREAT_07490, partial [Nitrosotalea sp.]